MEIYEPITNINIIGNDLPPILQFKYNIYYVLRNFLVEPTTNISVVGNDLAPIVELNYNSFPEMPSPTRLSEVKGVQDEHQVEIKTKNLVSLENTTYTTGGVTVTIEDNVITLNGTATSNIQFTAGGYFTIPAGTYTTSIYIENVNTSSGSCQFNVSEYGHFYYSGSPYGHISNILQTSSTTETYTITEPLSLEVSFKLVNNSIYDNVVIKLQVEKGSEATSYSNIHKDTQIFEYDLGVLELYKINDDYKNYIFYNLTDEKWYLYKRIEKSLLSSIVTTSSTSNDDYIVFRTGYSDHTLDATSDEVLCYSEAFTYKGLTTSPENALSRGSGIYKYYYNGIAAVLVTIPKSITSTWFDFRDWCENNNINLYYALEEAVITEIQDYDLIEKLNVILQQGKLYETNMIVEDVATNVGIVGDIEVNYLTNTTFNGIYASRAELNITQNSIESTVSETFTTSVQPVIDSVNMLGEQLQNTEANLQSNIDDVSNSLNNYALNSSLVTVTNTVQNIQTALNQQILVSKELQENGVTKVTTTTGFTFDENGLSITKTGADTRTVVDEDGLTVYSATGSSETPLLDVNSQGVETENLHVRTYTQIGSHSRLQDYEDGTAIFYIA